ncbi:MAG: cell wall-binding repeat-containing protein, partial [Mycobacterium sp.]
MVGFARTSAAGARVALALLACLALVLAFFVGRTTPAAAAAGTVTPAWQILPPNPVRISGPTRIQTAIAASRDEFPSSGTAKAVVLARSDAFPDALAGGPLAAKVGGPLLLTPPSGLDPATRAEIARVAPVGSTVYLLGSTAALQPTVDAAITALGDKPQRIFGSDRFATAAAIADQLGDPTTVFEATGLDFPDALAAGPAAITSDGAILLTNGTQQAPATAAY